MLIIFTADAKVSWGDNIEPGAYNHYNSKGDSLLFMGPSRDGWSRLFTTREIGKWCLAYARKLTG